MTRKFLVAALCILCTADAIVLNSAQCAEVLREGNTAFINVELVEIKAGAGRAFIDVGRLYKGDSVIILSKRNLSTWVKIQSGKMIGYLPLKVLRFKSDQSSTVQTSEEVRRLKDYAYDVQGRRIDQKGDRVGSGKDVFDSSDDITRIDVKNENTFTTHIALGVGRFERKFESNAPLQSLLSVAEAKPVVATTSIEVTWVPLPQLSAQLNILDYRLGETSLQSGALNNGEAFAIENDGQVYRLRGSYLWRYSNTSLGVGPSLHFQHHGFQPTRPVPVFLTSSTASIGADTFVSAQIPGARLGASFGYAIPIYSEQDGAKATLNSGTLWHSNVSISVPITSGTSVLLNGGISSEEIERSGESGHVDSISAPGENLSYTASKEKNMISSAQIGILISL